jgi:LmbE family N-acetylglucosaminyl deacetylase
MKNILTLAFFLFFSMMLQSQPPQSWTSAEMYQAIRKLNVLGSVLYVAAHPDDENTRLISWLSKDKLFRTGYLSITRGDGGQNLIGDEQGIDLGLIRTQELLAARRVDGGEQFFTRAIDFGYSKTPEETFIKWDKEKILSDVVWIIRKFQPDVIITRFPTTGEGGHGHHTASAILANEAFEAAADPNRFKEQLKFVQVWKAKRVLWNTFNFGGNNTQREDQYKIDVGGYNPLLGKSYGEISAESRSQHKSQGFGVPASRGEALEYFKATKGDQPANDLMEGIDVSWKRMSGSEVIEKLVDSLSASFDFIHPGKSVKGLVKLYKSLQSLPEGYWRNKKIQETQQLIEQCSGLFIDVTSPEQFAVQTDSVRINFSFNNRLGTDAILQNVKVDHFDSSFTKTLERNKNFNFSKTIYVPADKKISEPYWLAEKTEEGYFNVSNQQKIGQPDVDPAYRATVQVKIFDEPFNFNKAVKYKFTNPVRGELYEPLVVIPSMLITSEPELRIVVNKEEKLSGELLIQAKKKNIAATVHTDTFLKTGKSDPQITFNPISFGTTERNQTMNVSYSLKTDSSGTYRFLAKDNNLEYYSMSRIKEIKYDHIPYINYRVDPVVEFKKVDVKTFNKKIGYIIGAGDKIPEALEQMGYEVTLLTEKELAKNNLDKFDAIIAGVRAYNTNDWMNKYYNKLMKYVNDGGNYIVQYNTSNQLGPIRAKISPYNFDISRIRITDENAPVTFLRPEHPVMNFPNKITQEDFKGWVQERSIYHATGYDTTKFQTIFSMNDPGEKQEAGSLIFAKHGKGWFTYTGLVFFRELPAGVPGAYRLLANIIALNKKKAF